MTKIEHIDGLVTLDSFAYALDVGGLITRTTQVDGSYWDYGYDDRYRLTTANRFEAGGNVKAAYAYTYDDGALAQGSWVYAVVAQDCSPSNSGPVVSLTIVIP